MADQEHLDLLLQGVEDWNIRRKQGRVIRPDLSGANLSGVYLGDVNLYRANLTRADLIGADLIGAELGGADLSFVNFREANLHRADLVYADLRGADLTRADLSEAHVGQTIFGNVDLRTVKGLEIVNHHGPSTIGTDTISRSEGEIPEKFLRDAGLTESFIAYAHSLKQNPIKYYTCFLSYSSKDQEFAKQLYADLQSKGISCWFAPEDLKIGDEFRNRIDEYIRLYDKLLIILSRHSIQSSWVKTEVEAAFEKEQRQNKLVLFPIKLDESVIQTSEAWAADISRRRHIGDFTHWKEHDAYQVAFQRLLRDLQTNTIPPIRKS